MLTNFWLPFSCVWVEQIPPFPFHQLQTLITDETQLPLAVLTRCTSLKHLCITRLPYALNLDLDTGPRGDIHLPHLLTLDVGYMYPELTVLPQLVAPSLTSLTISSFKKEQKVREVSKLLSDLISRSKCRITTLIVYNFMLPSSGLWSLAAFNHLESLVCDIEHAEFVHRFLRASPRSVTFLQDDWRRRECPFSDQRKVAAFVENRQDIAYVEVRQKSEFLTQYGFDNF
jgi:hypothetical protein